MNIEIHEVHEMRILIILTVQSSAGSAGPSWKRPAQSAIIPILQQFKFCGDCGHDLTQPSPAIPKELSFDEKIAKIQKYLPPGITEKILSQRDRIEGEKRQVTVMFCDMKSFTPLSEKLGPEAVYAMMDEVFEILIRKVHEYEGTVNEMTGMGSWPCSVPPSLWRMPPREPSVPPWPSTGR